MTSGVDVATSKDAECVGKFLCVVPPKVRVEPVSPPPLSRGHCVTRHSKTIAMTRDAARDTVVMVVRRIYVYARDASFI